tara:strand:- start:460 stop:1905 length:1446 start_codon:yes stop_codon:yes gene_type:complete
VSIENQRKRKYNLWKTNVLVLPIELTQTCFVLLGSCSQALVGFLLKLFNPAKPNKESQLNKNYVLCRKCLNTAFNGHFCPTCKSDLIIKHSELETLSIAHIDCDAFYASIEKRGRPDIKYKPVIVGGQNRGVVMAACYVARKYGVRSAMPMFKALELCPEAIVFKPNLRKYRKVSREIHETMLGSTPLIEPISIDEAFLDLTGTERLHRSIPAKTLAKLAIEIRKYHGVSVTIGLSYNKFLAKLGSGINKPSGFTVIGKQETTQFLSVLPVSHIWGVGKVMQKKLKNDGITDIGDIQRLAEKELVRRYGAVGNRLAKLSFGIDPRRISTGHSRKSLSSETTFRSDLSKFTELKQILWKQAEKVSAQAKKEGIGARTITLKLKTNRFTIITRSKTLPEPTQLAENIYSVLLPSLQKESKGISLRLLGIGLSNLFPAADCDSIDFAEPSTIRRKQIEYTLDSVRKRFGREAINKGRTFEIPDQ